MTRASAVELAQPPAAVAGAEETWSRSFREEGKGPRDPRKEKRNMPKAASTAGHNGSQGHGRGNMAQASLHSSRPMFVCAEAS